MFGEFYNSFSVSKEIFWNTGPYRKNIIIEVDELLIKPLYPMKKHLDGRTVEGRQILLRNDILMQDNFQIIPVNPLRQEDSIKWLPILRLCTVSSGMNFFTI